MQYIIGIDGGGTKTLMKLADLDGNLLACCEGGPANINSLDRTAFEETLSRLMADGLKQITGKPSDCRAICLGMAGAGRPAEKQILKEILGRLGFNETVMITDDAHIALYGGVGSEEGIILVSGTGSICYGRNSRGEVCRAGGWGYILGDEGSGYDIGLSALKHTVRGFDKREEDSLLSTMILDKLKIGSVDELVSLIYRSGEGRKIIAGLALVVDEACMSGDYYAERILKNAVSELFKSIQAVISGLNFTDIPIQVALGGSVLLKSRYISNNLRNTIAISYPGVRVFNIKNDAAWGAVHMAFDQLNGKEIKI